MTAGDGAQGAVVGILMGSDTDLPVMGEAGKTLEDMDYEDYRRARGF